MKSIPFKYLALSFLLLAPALVQAEGMESSRGSEVNAAWATGYKGQTSITLTTPSLVQTQTLQPWMSSEVGAAWAAGYKGQTANMIVVDTFNTSIITGNLLGVNQTQAHGYWTSEEAQLIAPLAKETLVSYNSTAPIQLASNALNAINLSFAMYAKSGYSASQISWSQQEKSLITYAANGSAVISKAAGNDYGTAVGKANTSGQVDYLNLALVGAKSAIFVGALNSNGTITNKATMASYSNVAGTDANVQQHFLVVGVTGSTTGLYGTSFAAPIITGYSAILASKFAGASATAVTNQLLNTARTDTVANYNAAVYGKGEASLTRALAPVSIK